MYKTIILKNCIETVLNKMLHLKNQLSNDGHLFCLIKNEYDNNGNIIKSVFDVIEHGDYLGYKYVNTIIIPFDNENISSFDNIYYLIWFVKDKTQMFFDKDKIREKHIWKDVEWGKREKNYNSKGKDPGNVWIPTLDDGKGKITSHILLSIFEVYDRVLKSTILDSDDIYLLTDNKEELEYKFDNNFINFEYIKSLPMNFEDKYLNEKIEYVSDGVKVNCKVIFGTSENMNCIKNDTVDLVVTSPPYWDLKDYFKKNQIGQESYEKYAERMKKVWSESFFKLKDSGSLWININIRVRDNQIINIPNLFIKQCKELGFYFKGILIWHKSSGIPTNSKNLVDRYEFVLIFSKTDKNFIKSLNLNNFSDYKNDKINNGFIWNINRKAGSVGKKTIHPAIFPTELIIRIVQLSTKERDLVLDPFLGSGTSAISSINENRNFIGFEYNEGFCDLMNERFEKEIRNFEKNMIEFENQL